MQITNNLYGSHFILADSQNFNPAKNNPYTVPCSKWQTLSMCSYNNNKKFVVYSKIIIV